MLASEGPPVDIKLVGDFRAAVAGETYHGQLQVRCGIAVELTDFALVTEGWQPLELAAPAAAQLSKDRELTIDFSARCLDPTRPLVVTCRWNGHLFRKRIDLSPERVRLGTTTMTTRSIEGPPSARGPAEAGLASPTPHPDDLPPKPDDGGGGEKRLIRVIGRFTYVRPDGNVIGVDGLAIRVYDHDPGADDHIATTITNSQGYFDHSFDYHDRWEDYPDIYFRFKAANSEAEIEHPHSGNDYEWETGVYADIHGELDIGTISSGDESVVPALHLLTGVIRTWRWCMDYGYDPSYVEVEWPDDESRYTRWNEEIHIAPAHEWDDQTICHEFGHHFLYNYAETPYPDYCNTWCDDPECSHCVWCEEDANIAWSEGFPNYLAYVIPHQYDWRYGVSAVSLANVNDIDPCGASGLHPPDITEGFVAACLVDIDDDDGDEDHTEYPDYRDRTSEGAQYLLDCVDDNWPLTVMEFLLAYKNDYPASREPLWETAANCGYDIDTENPDAPPSVWSTSHTTGDPSADATVNMTWTRPSDDASGAFAYSYQFSGSQYRPDAAAEVEWTRSCTSHALSSGTYWFCVRTQDWAGNWSDDYASYGPIVIREPEPSNLREIARAGWDYPLVPADNNGSSSVSAEVSATLPGDTYGTYWNISGTNDGESATSEDVIGRIYIDGVDRDGENFGVINAGQTFYHVNSGPFTVRGGRHVLHYKFDWLDDIAETNETDNTCGRQFVWTPLELTPDVVVSAPTMEHALAGWEHVDLGALLAFNCRGYRFSNSPWWNACVMWSHDVDDNYTLRLHHVSTGAEDGFFSLLAHSVRPAGYLDAVIVNRNMVTMPTAWDAGVMYGSEDFDVGYDIMHVQNDVAAIGVAESVTIGPDNWLKIYEFNVHSDEVGPLSVVASTEPPTANVQVQWRGSDYMFGGLLDCDADAATGADGTAILQFHVPGTGYNSVCLFRDPRDGDDDVVVTFEIMIMPPDLAPYTPANWHAPLVPRPADDGTPSLVALPDTLIGNLTTTYYNAAFENLSAGATVDTLDVEIWRDELYQFALHYLQFAPYTSSRFNYPTPFVVPGGRHTLTLNIDPRDETLELDDANNWYGEQFVWGPRGLSPGTGIGAPAPPPRMAGWQYVTSGVGNWYNCDGLRLRDLSDWWAVMAVMPGVHSNVDVRLHTSLMGVQEGFAQNLALSSWGTGQSDYVLINFNLVMRRPFDAGVLNLAGTENYHASCMESVFLDSFPSGTYGLFDLRFYTIVRLHEMRLPAGPTNIRLENAQGALDWGICLHPRDVAFMSKSQTVLDGASWLNGPGDDESISVDLDEEGYYCLAVWKVDASDMGQTGRYNLVIGSAVTDVIDPSSELPQVTALGTIYPNPFNPQTTLAFDIVATTPVRLVVYDVTGRRVRTLVDEVRSAGRHQAVWDGSDEQGRQVASGTYVARLVTRDVQQSRKLLLVK